MSDKAENDHIQPVRCYSCGHQFGAVPNRLDTACPECGSDSFVRMPPASEGGQR